ncbi:MAG: UbiX family flavin prenyltransferase [Acidobacteriota bacterium]
MRRYVVGVTGASGSLCARSVLCRLLAHPEVEQVHVVLSRFSLMTIRAELEGPARSEEEALRTLLGDRGPGARAASRRPRRAASKIVLHRSGDMAAAISSGSYDTNGMVIVPCSGGTLAAVANGVTGNLLHRAAEVTLKERRPLVLAFRETPVSLVHIENMRLAARAGAVIYPLIPAFYQRPGRVEEVVEGFTSRIFDLLRLRHDLGQPWGGRR